MLIPIGSETERERVPYVNYVLIGVNVLVYALLAFRPEPEYEEILYDHGLIPAQVTLLDLLTSMFLHGDIFHIVGNMLFLWIVGGGVEERFGHVPYLVFYLAAGAAAAATQVMLTTEAMAEVPMIGASGAVSGTVGAFLLLFPRSKIKMLLWLYIIVHVFRVSSWVIILLWVALEVFRAWQETQGAVDNVAVWAHLGGFAFGAATGLLWILLSPLRRKRRAK